MKNLRLLLACAIALATAFLAVSCSKTPAPETFTGQLDNIDGAMFFVSLQHPKLVVRGINKLTAEIPEASALNMLLAGYGGRFGYPEFSDIAPGTNIGVYMPAMTLDELKRGKPSLSPVLFIKLKENGKIWNTLVNQAGMEARKHGDWAMFAQNTADFDAVKNPDAIIARLSAPQAENLRVWACLNGDTAAAYKTLLNDAIAKALDNARDKDLLDDAGKTAFTAYTRVLLDEFLSSTHSAHATLNLGDNGLRLAFGAQFKPDTATGTLLRYRADATPAVAQYIPNDALYSGVVRFTPKALNDYNNHLLDLILKVDYPPVSEPLAKFKQDTASYYEQMDGCGAVTVNMDMNLDFKNPRASKNIPDAFYVYSGKFDERGLKPLRTAFDFLQKFMTRFFAFARANLRSDVPKLTITNKPGAATIDGHNFDMLTLDITGAKANMAPINYYYGVAGGNLIIATQKDTLQKRLPALLAKKTQPDNVAAANPLQPYEQMNLGFNGAALADMICKTAKIDLTDADAQATIAGIKESYKQAGPARFTLEARQAGATFAMDIPYKFITDSVQLGRYIYSVKNTAGE